MGPVELRERLNDNVRRAKYEMERGVLHQALPLYSNAILFLSHMAWIGHIPKAAFSLLSDADMRIPGDAAACAVASGHLEKALELLEHGRCSFWGQALNLRISTAAIRGIDIHLADRLKDIARQIEAGPSDTKVRYSLADEYGRLVLDARKHVPDFAKPLTFAQIAPRLQGKTVVTLVASRYGCFALVVRHPTTQIEHVPLPLITWSSVQDMEKSLESALLAAGRDVRDAEGSERHIRPRFKVPIDVNVTVRDILNTLWTTVVCPILSYLDIQPCEPGGIPTTRLWWCATGPFAFLPIHAAGIFTHPIRCCLDYVISSYTPKLDVLPVDNLTNPLPLSLSLLTIGEIDTPGQVPLPEVEPELQQVRALGKKYANETVRRYQLGLGPSALARRRTVENILDRIRRSEIVHIASHASQDVLDPLSSAIYFPPCQLSIAQLWSSNMQYAKTKLVVLSACQTAAGARDIPNEAIHLAGTLVFAGVPSVVGTMWSIVDADGPAFANTFYTHLFQRGPVNLGYVAEAVHVAIQNLRSEGLPFSRWVPFLHMGN